MTRSTHIRRRFLLLALTTLLIPTLSTRADQTVNGHPIRIFNCDDHVRSHKRGVCANHLAAADFTALAPGVAWWYNWHYEPSETPPAGVDMQFIPMAWGDRQGDLDGLERYLSSGHKPQQILAINEPNLKGQAFIPPEQTAKLFAKIKAIAEKHGIPVTGPHMALGSSNNDSIKAMDPVEKKELTYTFMVPFLKAFLFYAGDDQVHSMAFHSYGSIDEMHWAVDLMFKTFNRPVWVTEYAQWKTPNDAASLRYLVQSTDFLERNPNVPGYAWFKERVDKNPRISLLQKEPGKLTPLGEAYVALPVHDVDVYYRLPGKLPAGNYVTMQKMEVEPATSGDGVVDMIAKDRDATVDYNVVVASTGSQSVNIHTGGAAGKIEIAQGEQVLVTVESTGAEWQKLAVSIKLNKGPQVIRLRVSSKGQTIGSIEFAK